MDQQRADLFVQTAETACRLAATTALSVERHGQAAGVRAIARPQRAPASVQPF